MGGKQFYFYGKKNSTGPFLRIVEKSKTGSNGKLIIEGELMEAFSEMVGTFLEPCIELGSTRSLAHPSGKEGRDYHFGIVDHPDLGPSLEMSQVMGLKQIIVVPHHGLSKFQGALDHMIIATQGLQTPMATPRYMTRVASVSQTPAQTPRLVSQTPACVDTRQGEATPRATPAGQKEAEKPSKKKNKKSSFGDCEASTPISTPKPREREKNRGEESKSSLIERERVVGEARGEAPRELNANANATKTKTKKKKKKSKEALAPPAAPASDSGASLTVAERASLTVAERASLTVAERVQTMAANRTQEIEVPSCPPP